MPDLDSPAVEVRCHHCDVSFPVGTKRCIHCGERLGRPRFGAPPGQRDPEEADDVAILRGAGDLDPEEADAEPQSRLLRAGFTLFWVVVAVLSGVIRSCQGQ